MTYLKKNKHRNLSYLNDLDVYRSEVLVFGISLKKAQRSLQPEATSSDVALTAR